jgi:FAD/FMN-containing dehydrogenase
MSETFLRTGDPGWDEARQAWNLAVDQHPAAIARPACVQDVVAAVQFARTHGLRVAAQGTGHNAGPLGALAGTMLVKTTAMRRVSIDPGAKIARAEAGAVWRDVVAAAAGYGLAALAGSAPSVGVVGYTIGGGISWLGRAYGLAASNVAAIEIVTADGRLVRADAGTETDLFWALRGGGGSFGVVTAIELRLFPITEVYAGQLWWPADAAAPVLQAWRELTGGDLPEEFTSAARLANFPQIPAIPEDLRGRSFIIVFTSHLGSPAEADALLAPLRALRPGCRGGW